jgi:CIC family chloride channel protein
VPLTNIFKKLGLSCLVKSGSNSNHIAIFEACLIGIAAGLSAIVLESGVSFLGGLRVYLSYMAPAIIVLPLFGLIGGIIAGFLIEKISPETTGSGIPQVKAALMRAKASLNLKVAFTKLLGGIVTLGSGFFMGREGPTVHVAAALSGQLNKWLPTTPLKRRQLIASGAGAGLAAAFNAPIAGVLFVAEELLKDISAPAIGTALLACFVASVISHFFCHHSNLQILSSQINIVTRLVDIPFFVLLGILAGVFGALFNRGIILFLTINEKFLRMPITLKIGLAGLLSGLIIASLPATCRDYAYLRELIIIGDTSIANIPIIFLAFFLLTLIAYGSGAPGGLFAPSLALGSCLGSIISFTQAHLIGHSTPEFFALIGMGAFFAAVARVPITAIVIVFEMTMNFSLVLPLMIVCLIATQVAEKLYKGSIYDRLISYAGIDLNKTQSAAHKAIDFTAKDIMTKDIELMENNLSIKQAKEIFSKSHHRGFPVMSQNKLVGILSQSDIDTSMQEQISETEPISTIMTTNPITVDIDNSLEDILYLMDRWGLSRLPVMEDKKLIGLITRTNVIDALYKQLNS